MKSGRNHTQKQSATRRPAARQPSGTKRRRTEASNLLRQYQLRVTPANDSYEREADRVAQQVTQMQAGQESPVANQITPLVQRQATADEEEAMQAKALQRQDALEEDEEPVQARMIQRQDAPVEDEEEPVQAKMVQRQDAPMEDEEEPVQAKAIQRQDALEEDEEPVQARRLQRQAAAEEEEAMQPAGEEQAVSPTMEERIQQLMQGGGRPLGKEMRDYFEPRFGADFSQVRIHDDAEAARIAAQMNARAFTQGQHIFFGAGQYRPNDPAGRELLGHELTHTIQQGAVSASTAQPHPLQRTAPVIQRANNSGSSAGGGGSSGGSTGGSGGTNQDLHLPELPLPQMKYAWHLMDYQDAITNASKSLYRSKKYTGSRGSGQSTKWDNNTNASSSQGLMEYAGMRPNLQYLIRPKEGFTSSSERIVEYFGTPAQIAPQLVRPYWSRTGAFTVFEVDHVVELQVSGWPDKKWADEVQGDTHNYELLDRESNNESGDTLRRQIDSVIQRYLTNSSDPSLSGLSVDDVKSRYDIYFDSISNSGAEPTATNANRWTQTDIQTGAQIRALYETPRNQRQIEVLDFSNPEPSGTFFSPHSLSSESIIGSDRLFVVYPVPGRFTRAFYRWDQPVQAPEEYQRSATNRSNQYTSGTRENDQLKGFTVYSVVFRPDRDNIGTLVGKPYSGGQRSARVYTGQDVEIQVRRLLGVVASNQPAQYAGFIPPEEWQKVADLTPNFNIPGASPLRLDNIYYDPEKGLTARGKLLPTVPFIAAADIDVVLMGNDIRLEKTFAPGDLTTVGPIQITQSTLTLGIGTESGISVGGRTDFQINRVGQGYLEGSAQTGRPGGAQAGFALGGGFTFDTQLFEPAQIDMWYREEQFGARGILRIPSGRLNGIRSAEFTVAYENETITASGTAQFAAPGIQQAGLNLTYSDAEGLIIGGTLQLGEVPGLRGGSLEAQVQQKPDGSYKVSASGTAQPAIPGVASQVRLSYDDGIFDANVTASYQRGMLSGQATIGATNRPVDENNQPTGEPTNQVRAYGGGQVTVQIAPWLQGTVGIRLLPNGEIELAGEIALPSAVDIFPRRSIEKNIFTLNIDIPIVGVAVAGQRIGVFATVGGGLDVSAGIGPGQIQELRLGIQYNPDHEEETHVYGRGQLHIPADAGLRLFVRGGVGVGIPIVSATAGLEVSGQLGIEGAIGADVAIDWQPRTGLEITANANIFAEPTLRLSVDAYVEVTADLLLTEIDLYSERWNLAAIEYGSGLRFGINFPIHYLEGHPFDIALDDVQFTVPSIDARSVIGNVLQQF